MFGTNYFYPQFKVQINDKNIEEDSADYNIILPTVSLRSLNSTSVSGDRGVNERRSSR